MTKITDLEADLADFKTTTGDRLDKLEAAVEALTTEVRQTATEARKAASDTDQRFTEILAAIRTLQQPLTTIASATLPPPSTVATRPLVPFAPPSYDAHGRPLPFHQTTDSPPPPQFQPPPHPAPSTQQPPFTRPSTQPVTFASNRIFDEFGYPIPNGPPPRFSEVNSSLSATSYVAPRMDTYVPRYAHSGTGLHDPHLYGLDQPENRVWVPGADYRLRKLKMPLFEGEDVYGWIYRIERFFDIQGFVTTGERLRASVLCMEGQALSWYRWSVQRTPFRSWEQLKVAMLDRFQTSHNGDLYEQFLAIKQDGTARAYVSLFESLAAQLDGVPEKVLEGTFLNGLRPDLRTSVRMLQPTGLGQSMKLAIMIDESRSRDTIDPTLNNNDGILEDLTNRVASRPTMPNHPMKRMSEAELQERRAKGLCFRCDSKYTPGHRCPAKTLQVLVIPDSEATSEGEEEPDGAHVHAD